VALQITFCEPDTRFSQVRRKTSRLFLKKDERFFKSHPARIPSHRWLTPTTAGFGERWRVGIMRWTYAERYSYRYDKAHAHPPIPANAEAGDRNPGGERTLSACWSPHSAATNFSCGRRGYHGRNDEARMSNDEGMTKLKCQRELVRDSALSH
jgi:hypothetical protein